MSSVGGIVQLLREGNQRYLRNGRRPKRPSAGRSPEPALAAVLSCSDMKEPPASLFDLDGQELIAITNPAHVVGRDEIAAAHSASRLSGVKLGLVLGHTGCDWMDIYMGGGRVASTTLRNALDESRLAAVAVGGPRVEKRDLVRAHACRMAQTLRMALGGSSGVVVGAAKFDESSGRVTFF